MKSFAATASIEASPEAIWAILTDAPNYAAWDSGVVRVEGQIAPGATITVYSAVNPGRAFPVKVTEFDVGRKMVWTGGMPLGLFKGVRTFTLEPGAGAATTFTMREEYSGPLAPVYTRSIPDLGPSFHTSPRPPQHRFARRGSSGRWTVAPAGRRLVGHETVRGCERGPAVISWARAVSPGTPSPGAARGRAGPCASCSPLSPARARSIRLSPSRGRSPRRDTRWPWPAPTASAPTSRRPASSRSRRGSTGASTP